MAKTILLRWLPVILWAGGIFFLSSFSNPYAFLLPAPLYIALPHEQLGQFSHTFVYVVLAFLLARALVHKPGKRINLVSLPAWGMAVVYALSDEIHQLFVPGRTFQLADLALDALGALVGVLIFRWVSAWPAWLASRKSQPNQL